MKFKIAIEETTLWTKGGGKKTKHDEKRNKFASKDIHYKDYKKAKNGEKAYSVWVRDIRTKM